LSREDREPGQEHGAVDRGKSVLRTKIVCTIGLASREPETLEALIRAAADKVGKAGRHPGGFAGAEATGGRDDRFCITNTRDDVIIVSAENILLDRLS
jgi:hypothetical protein